MRRQFQMRHRRTVVLKLGRGRRWASVVTLRALHKTRTGCPSSETIPSPRRKARRACTMPRRCLRLLLASFITIASEAPVPLLAHARRLKLWKSMAVGGDARGLCLPPRAHQSANVPLISF